MQNWQNASLIYKGIKKYERIKNLATCQIIVPCWLFKFFQTKSKEENWQKEWSPTLNTQ